MPTTTYTVINGVIVHEDRDGVQRNYRPDTQGNTVALTDANSVTDRVSYWPYGEVRTRTGTNPTRFLYVGTLGYSQEGGHGLHYVRARHYQASRGRWTSVDPLWPRESAYGYVRGRAQQAVDPLGRNWRYTSGPADEAPYAHYFPPDDLLFKYGLYCGKENWRTGPCPPAPYDCIDAACKEHDECLHQAGGYFSLSGAGCHCRLALRALGCSHLGCLFGNTRNAIDVLSCLEAAAAVAAAFLAICAVSGVTGIGDWVGGSSGQGGGPPAIGPPIGPPIGGHGAGLRKGGTWVME